MLSPPCYIHTPRRQGTFGTVHKVRCRGDGELYCLKRIPLTAGGGGGGALTEAKVRLALALCLCY